MSKVESKTDWERVRREAGENASIAYDPNDPDDGSYDPNDDAAVEAFWNDSTIIYQGRVIQKGNEYLDAELEPVTLKLSPAVVDRFRSQGFDINIRSARISAGSARLAD